MSEKGNALLMYAQKARSWVVLGDPVGDEEEFCELILQFRNRVYRHDGWPVLLETTPRFLPCYLDAGLTPLKVGEEGRVPVASFSLECSHRSDLRQTVRRVERDGGSFQVVPRDEQEPLLPDLRAYKEKFDPIREPRYLASPGGAAFPFILSNLASLISGSVAGALKR